MSLYYQDGQTVLHHGDAASVLAALPDGSADCIVTSPPYFGLRDYGADFYRAVATEIENQIPEEAP